MADKEKKKEMLINIAGWSFLIVLLGITISLPFWNPHPMTLASKVWWWVIFGGSMIYLCVQSFRT